MACCSDSEALVGCFLSSAMAELPSLLDLGSMLEVLKLREGVLLAPIYLVLHSKLAMGLPADSPGRSPGAGRVKKRTKQDGRWSHYLSSVAGGLSPAATRDATLSVIHLKFCVEDQPYSHHRA